MKKFSPIPQDANDNKLYLIGAVIASSMAGIALAALVLFLCVNKDRRDEPKEAQRDDNPLLNLSSGAAVSPGTSSDKPHTLSSPSGINFKSSSTFGTSFNARYGASIAASPEIEANAEEFRRIPLPLPPARAAAARAAAAAAAAGTTAGAPVAYPGITTASFKGTAMGTMVAPAAGMEMAAGAGAEPVAAGLVAGAKEPEPSAAKPTVAAPPPPPQPKIPTAAPPPPPRPCQRPPPPLPAKPSPLGPHHRRNSTGGESVDSDDSGVPKAKLKPFFWDKVLASPDQSMVWHELKAGSFQFDEDMMEALFGYSAADQKKQRRKEASASESTPQFIQIIDPKKSQNLAILLKALNVTSEEVCDALTEGNELPAEFIQNLLKMAPTTDEELKLRLYTGDLSLIGPAERFLKALIEIPFAFKRLDALLFVSTFQEEFSSVKQSLATLELACEELKNSRLFLKLLEAVLKTGNRMNDGTYRGGAQAFKLDTLLKLSDVKGTDGKTSLLHFVVHEIIRGEGIRAARRMREGQSISSVKTEDFAEEPQDTEEYFRSLGLQEVAGLSSGLLNVKKAAVIDLDIISDSVYKLGQARFKTKEFLETEMKDLEEDSKFLEILSTFVNQCESDSAWLLEEEKRISDLVKSTGDYFYGRSSGKDEGAHLFVIVRDFLVMVDKACQDVKSSIKLPSRVHRRDAMSPSLSPSPSQDLPPESTHDMQSRLFPAMRARQLDDEPNSDDEK